MGHSSSSHHIVPDHDGIFIRISLHADLIHLLPPIPLLSLLPPLIGLLISAISVPPTSPSLVHYTLAFCLLSPTPASVCDDSMDLLMLGQASQRVRSFSNEFAP